MPSPLEDPQFKRFVLQSNGLDPEQYDLGEDGVPIPKPLPTPQPTLNESEKSPVDLAGPTIPQLKTAAMQAAGHHGLASILPTMGGLGAGGIASLALAPETGGLSLLGLLGVGAASAVGAGAVSAGQNALLPDEAKQQLALESSEHPVASFLGDQATQAAAFNPLTGAKNLVKAFSTGGESVAKGFAKSTVANMGVSGAIDAAQQALGDQPFDYGRLGEAVGTAALYNEPNALGKKLMFHREAPKVEAPSKLPQTTSPIGVEEPLQTPDTGSRVMYPEGTINSPDSLNKRGRVGKEFSNGRGELDERPNEINASDLGIGTQGDIGKAFPTGEDEITRAAKAKVESDKKAEDFEKAKEEIRKQQELEVEKGRLELLRQKNAEAASDNAARALELKRSLEEGRLSAPESRTTPLATTETGNEIMPDYTGNVEHDNNRVEAESPADLEARKQEARLSGENPNDVKYQDEPAAQPEDREYSFRNSPPEYRQAVSRLAAKRGVSIREAMSLINPATGKEILGKVNTSARDVVLNRKEANIDTPIHEIIGHQYVEDLASSPDKADQRLAQQTKEIFASHEKGSDEGLAIEQGVRGANRLVNELQGTPAEKARQWAKEFVSRWKVNLHVNGTEDTLTHLAQRGQTDAEHFGYQGVSGKGAGSSEDKLQDSPSSKEDISKAYGSWMDREGKENGVRDHYDAARKMNPALADEVNPVKVYGKMFQDNYVRTVNEDKTIHVEGRDLTNAQRRALINRGIEDGKRVEFDTGLTTKPVVLYDPEEKMQDESALHHSTLRPFRSALDNVLAHDGEEAIPVVKAIKSFFPLREQIRAGLEKPLFDAAKGTTKEQQNKVEDLVHDERYGRKSLRDTLTDPSELKLYDAYRSTLVKKQTGQIEANQPVTAYNNKGEAFKRQAKIDEFYSPQQLSPEVIAAVQENRNSPESKRFGKIYADHQVKNGASQEQAQQMWKDLSSSFDKATVGNRDHFRGVDIEQGAGLPKELMRPGLLRNMQRYIGRVSSARAFHDAIESNPEVASKLGFKTTPWGKPLPESDFHSPRVNEIISHIQGEPFDAEESKVKAWNRIATSAMLGALTNIHIAVSSTASALSNFQPHEVVGAIKAMMTDFHGAVERATENGTMRQNRKLFDDLTDAHATGVEKLNSLADGIARLNGRDATAYLTKGILQASGEHLVRSRLPLAQHGDADAIRFMEHVDPNFTKDKVYDEKEISKVASNFSSLMHGGHDARTMPTWMLHDGAIQPFLSLASWSIGQTNNFMRNVITPAKEGNFTPLLMSTLGAGLGGYAIKELREKLANKKSPIPSFSEIANSPRGVHGNLPLVGYNLAAMASFAGYAGILSTGLKTVFDAAYKNVPQGATFPLDEVAGNVLDTSHKAISALMNTSDPKEYVKIGTHAIMDLLRENIQSARLVTSWGDEAGIFGKDRQYKKNLNKEEDDLRRYKQVSGLPYTDQSSGGANNPYNFENRKAFKHTLDLGEAAKQLPSLIHEALVDSTIDGRLDPEVFREKLKALKGSDFPSMPDPERTPYTFYKYLNFLRQTEGPEAASKRMFEYVRNNAIGKMRSSMVPSL